MNRAHPLINPAPRDFSKITSSRREIEEDMEQVQVPKEQLKFPDEPRSKKMTQYFSSIRGQVKRRLDYVEVAQFWKNPGIPFMIVSFAFNLSLLLFGGIIVFGKLPPKLQLFYNPVEQTWSPENKVIPVFIIPIILICLYLLQYRFLKVIFKTDRRLAIVISWLMTLLNTFLLIGITQIYSLNQA